MICSPAGAHRWSWFILTTSLIWMGVCAIPGSARGQILTVPNEAKTAGDITPYRDALQKFLAVVLDPGTFNQSPSIIDQHVDSPERCQRFRDHSARVRRLR